MTNSPIRIGVIGAGANTRKMHIPGLLAIDDIEIISVCNRSIASGQRVAKEFNIPKVQTSWRDVVNDSDIDAVVIGTWPNMHKTLTCAVLESGKHVLCEARMAMNAAEAHAMWTVSKSRPDLIAQIVPSPFTLAFDRTIQDMMCDGFFGDLIAIDVRHITGEFVDHDSPLTWRQETGFSGYNIMTMGIWYEAIARWVGHARTVLAGTKHVVKLRPHPDGNRVVAIGVPDHVDIIANMECGAQARMQFSAVLGLATTINEAWIYGARGTARLDGVEKKLYTLRRGDGDFKEIEVPEEKKGRWRVEEEFINAIRGIEAVKLTTLQAGVRYMEFTEAVSLSAISGKTVTLPLSV